LRLLAQLTTIPQWYEYFLNASNHIPGTPINLISFHFYASCDNRTDPNSYVWLLLQYQCAHTQQLHGVLPSDGWFRRGGGRGIRCSVLFNFELLLTWSQIVRIRDALNPTVELFIDEVGVILPGDNSEPPPPDFPLVYWNAAGAAYAYLYGLTLIPCKHIVLTPSVQ
jgi:hypothetical protein